MPKWHKPEGDELTTVDVPLGQAHVSQMSGRVFRSSDLGYVDTPEPYAPDWSLLREEAPPCTPTPAVWPLSSAGN